MKLVLDTNVLIAAVISRGVCHELLEYCAQFHRPVISPFIVNELKKNLTKKFKFTLREAVELVTLYCSHFELLDCGEPDFTACRDKDDDNVLHLALRSKSRCIITGDKDLLVLNKFQAIDIIKPADFWRYEKARAKV